MACLCDLPQNGIGAKRCSGVIGIKSVYGGKSLGQTVDEGQHLELARLAAEFRQHRIHAACENMVPVLLYMDTGRAAVCMACLLVELVKREVFRLEFQRQQADLQCMVQFDGTSLAAAGCERIHIHTQGLAGLAWVTAWTVKCCAAAAKPLFNQLPIDWCVYPFCWAYYLRTCLICRSIGADIGCGGVQAQPLSRHGR